MLLTLHPGSKEAYPQDLFDDVDYEFPPVSIDFIDLGLTSVQGFFGLCYFLNNCMGHCPK